MPVSSSIQVSLSEVLQVRGGPLEEEELWSILCQSCKAIQDIFIQGRAIAADGPSFVVSPYTVLFSPTGTVQFAESIDVTLPNIANYLPPEGIGGQGSFSNAAVEKMYIYALGKSLLWASDYMRIPYSSAVIGATLQTLLMGMSDNNPVTRLGLVQILEACTIHAQGLGYGMPYARHIMQLSKIVLGSIFALDQMADSFNSNTNNSVSTVTGSPMSAGRSPEHRRSGRVSPGKRNHQQLNSSDSTDHKHKRTMRDYDEPDSRRGSRSKPRSRGYSNLSSSTMDSQDSYDDVRSHRDSLPRNRSSRNSREMLDERSSRRDASHRSNASLHGNGSEGRSYHMSDIFSPVNQTEKSNGYRALSEKSSHSRRSDSKHSKTHSMSRGYESLPERPSSRSKQRSPPPRGAKSSRTNLVYERLRERRERLGRLRDQLGLRPRYGKELTRSVSDYESETDTMTEDESQYGDGRSEARSYKSLTSVESARQGSYHPDQYSQYSSFGTLPFGQGLPSSSPQRQSRSVPNVHQQRAADHYDGVSNRDPSLERRLQAAPSSNEHRRNTAPSRKKLKKFFGPEFVVMSSEPNESITMPISFLSKAGKIPPEKKRVTAVMLNGRRLDLLCDLGTSGQELFDLIASHLGLNERSYFGLAYIKDGEYLFIDPDTKLYKVGPESWREEAKKKSKKLGSKEKFTVFFRVKYYVENVSLLRDQLTRHQYYLQLRRDILEERTKCDERSALQLAALALQAEMGDHDAGTSRNYFLPEHYVAAGMIESIGVANIRDRLPPLHEAQKGISDVDAELDFLMEARKLPEYGIHFHRVTHNKKETSRGVWLGVCTRGIIVYEKSGKVRKQVHAHPWNKTKKIAFDRRKFIVEPYDETGMKFVHFTESYKKGRYLVQLCKSQHRFHMAVRTKTNIAHQFQNDYGIEGESYSLASGSLRYANHYEPNDEFDYSDGEQSVMGSVPSELGASSYTIDSMRHHGIPEVKRSTSGYEDVKIGRPLPTQRKSPERRPQPSASEVNRQQRSNQVNEPYRNQTSGSRSNVSRQRVLRERQQTQDEYDGNVYMENGFEEVDRGRPRSRQGSREVMDDPPYATIESIKENRERRKQNRSRTPKIRGEESGYAEIGPRETEKPYVIGTSIHNDTRAQSRKSLDQEESISESLRERLEDLPPSERPERDIIIVTLKKSPQKGLGLTIVGGENSRSLDLGIFVRSIEPHGPAHRDGRLHVGDRIISINGQSLEGVGHRVAVDIIKNAPEVVQLIVSQPKSDLNSKLSSTPSTEVVYANVHHPANAHPSNLAPNHQSQGSLDNIQDLPNESSASDNSPKLRNKQFPPTKPRRRPESFGSSYSLNSDQERNGLAEGKHGRYLTVEKPRIVKRKGIKDDEEEEDDKGRITERDEDVSRMTPEDHHPKRNERDEEPASAGILDNLSADEWEDLDHDDDKDSKVTTPESSDMEDLFGDMDEKKNKPKLNFSKMSTGVESPPITATASTVTAMSPSSDRLTSATSPPARETERDNTEAEQEENLDEEVQEASEGLDLLPGDKYTVQLKKVNGSLGISVTGGVNTSVKHGGIYIKTMVPGGAADVDGRIKSGDRLLEVNGSSLTQVTHKQAVEILRRAKDLSTLVIERGIPPAATSALPPTPVHFQQPMQQQQQPHPQGSADPKGGNVDESGSGRGVQKDSIANQKTGTAGTEDIRISTNDEHSGTDFATENEDLDLGSADEEYETGWDDEEDDAPISKSDPMTVKEPTVAPTKIREQHSVAPSTGAMVLPDIKGDPSEKEQIDPDIDDTEPPVSPSSDDVALSPTDIHRMRSPQFHAQRKNSLGVIFHHDLEGSLASIRRTSSAASLGIHSEHTESDDGGSLMMPSFASHATTPTIEALQDDEYFHTPPLTDNDYASENEVEDVPEDDDVRPESRGSVTESPFASDGYSDEVDDYLAEIASPTLSTREADTLTPTAHLTGLRKSGKRKSWVSVASSHSPAPTESTQFGRTESSPRSSRRSQASHYSESAESAESAESGSEESGSMSFSDNDIAGHWSDNEDHKLVKSKLPAESTPKDANFVSRVAIKSPTSPEPPSESIQASPDSHPPSVPSVSPPHSSRSSSPTLSQASQISVTSPVPNEEAMSPNSTLSSVGALTLTQTMLSQTMMSTGYMSEIDMPNLPYVTAENTFEVQLNKGSQGLGFSVMGGKGTHSDPRKCLIRIKKLFAGQAASQSGLVEEGDVILAVNGEMVHDATHPETVAKLRGAQQNVKLLLCRPSEEELLRLLKKKSEESSAKENTAPPSPLDACGGNNNSTILSSPFSSPPLSPDPKISSAPLSPTANEPPPPPPPPTSPPHSEDEDSGEDVTDQSAPLDRSLPSEKPSPLSKMAAVDRSAFVEVPSALPKLGAVEVKSKIPISSKSKSQDLGMKGKPLLSPSSSTESSPRKMQQIMSEPSVDFEEDDVFEVRLVKPQRGGLGFTVAGGANTGGCYIKDILQEPAISDGRLQKGDKILEVNGRSMKGMSHFDAVSYLRMTPKEVILKVAHPSVKSTQPTPSPTKPVKTDTSASPLPKEDVVFPETAMDVQASPALTPAVDGGESRKDSPMSASASENDDDWSDVGSVESTPPTPKVNLREAFHARPKLQKSQDVNLDQEQKVPDSPSLEDLPSVVIKKNDKGQLGLLLGVEATDQGSGLFVKDVVKGLPMAQDGSVQVGDQIHFINSQSVSGISMEKAKSLLARVPSLVELKATRNKIPVQPKRQRPVSSASTLEPTETEDEERATPSAQDDNDDEWMTDSSEPPKEMGVPRTLPATPKSEAPAMKGKEVSPAGFDLDLGDVSEEESDWEDLSVSDKEEASRLDEVGDIMKDLERSHGGYTPQQSVDEEAKSPTRSVTSPLEIPTSPTSVASPPLSPLSPSTVPSTVKAFSSITEAPSPSLPDGGSDQHNDDLDSLGSNEAFSPSTTPQDLSTPERFNGSPRRVRHDSMEQELEPELAHLPPLPAGKASSTTPRGIKSPLGNFRRQMSLDARDSPTGSEFSTSARIGTPTGRPPSVQGSEGGNLSIGEGGIVWIELEKPEGGGLGFSVVGAEKGGKTSIFIKTVTPDGVAGRDGRLKVGDRLLQVNGQSLVGMTQNKVINILRKSKGIIRLAVTGQLSRPASLIGTDTERQTPSVAIDRLGRAVEERETSDAELSPAESYTESARDAGFRQPLDDDLSDHDEITAGSVTFDSSLSFTLPFSLAGLHSTQTFGDVAITPPPPEFRVGYPEQDTDSDIDSTADLPNDVENPHIPESPGKTSASLLAAQRLGRALQNRNSKQESDEDSLSWGSDNSLPLDDDNDISEAANGAIRGTPSTKILEDITDAQLESMAIVKPSEGGRYSGRGLRSSIAKIQKQIDKQDPAEEFKTLRQVKAIDNCEEAKKAQNKDKNRFRNVLPYDKTRVILEDSGPSDYINASHIKVQVGKDNYEYIACQGPLPNTTQDFWLMVWEQKADVIAMVTMDVENGKVKCHRYWPESANTPLMVYNRIEVRLENYQILENFTIRRILMIDTETSEVHHVTQMNFATWPDHSVPSTSLPLLRFACHMRRIHDNRLPIVVHCSAGIGRTGTLITLDVILGLIDRDEEFKVLNIVKGLRKQRQGMIQTKDQYIFCYKAALEALKTVLR